MNSSGIAREEPISFAYKYKFYIFPGSEAIRVIQFQTISQIKLVYSIDIWGLCEDTCADEGSIL